MNPSEARQLRHYQRRMVIYRRRLAWVMTKGSKPLNWREVVDIYQAMCDRYRARIAELEAK